MDPNLLIPLLLFSGSKQRMADIIKRTLPTALPGQPGQRFALAALVADRELKRQEQTEQEMIQEVVTVGHIKDSDELEKNFPVLHAVFVKLPAAVQARIVFAAAGARTA
jgi:hypothetical protein